MGLLLISLLSGCNGGADRAGGNSPAHPRTLRFVTQSAVPAEVAAWAQEVERASHGTLLIRFSPEWRHLDPNGELKTLDDVHSGRVDLAWVGARIFDRVGVTSFQPLLAPFLVDSYPLEQRVFADPLIGRMLSPVSRAGVTGLAVLPGPMRRMLGVHHPFLAPSDFAGSVVGMQNSRQSAEALRLLGATPRPMPAEASLDGVDGYEQQLAAIAGNSKLHAARDVTANLDLWPRPLVVVANDHMMKGLTALQRSALQRAGGAVLPRAMLAAAAEDTAAMATLCELSLRVVSATPADLRALRAAVQPIFRRLASQPSQRAALARITSLKAAVAAPPATMPGCNGAQLGPDVISAADGSYAVTVAPAELPVAGRLPEAYGLWRIVIDHGRLRLSHDSDGANWIADGGVVVTGDTMVWIIAHGWDVGPHGAPDGVPITTGQRVRFRWHLGAAGLQLTPLDPTPPLPALSLRPLARVGDAPGQQPRVDPRPLQGTWTTNATAADVIAHHDDANGIAGNTGPLRLIIRGDRFRWTQMAPDGLHYGVGTLRFAGDTVEVDATRTDGDVSPAPMFFLWSIYKGQLVFHEAPGFSAEAWAYHPWRRVGG
jgi:TRAP-type C4-dicarboxylate transport system substrate-binding protein